MSSNQDKRQCGLAGTVASHYNKLEEKGLDERKQSRIVHMRNYNNWTKSMLINDAINRIKSHKSRNEPVSVFDLCSGKGGDLLKWKICGIDHLVCSDIAETSVEQSRTRYNDLKERSRRERSRKPLFSAEFITSDCSKERTKSLYNNQNQMFDLTSCQFAIHYSFESLAQAEVMVQNACECLKPGGLFIGTTPNSNAMVKRLRESEDMSFGNDVYKVTFQLKDKLNIPLFGAKYNFYLEGVVNCPEFLVYFPLLEKLASKHNMELVYCIPFKEFHDIHARTEEGKSLLRKMMALERYPSHNKELCGNLEDYRHAEDFLDNRGIRDPSHSHVGTLSLPEWDATSLYLVFMFQKKMDSSSKHHDLK